MKLPWLTPGVSFASKAQLRLILPAANKKKKTPFSCGWICIYPQAPAWGVLCGIHEHAKREKISPLDVFREVAQVAKYTNKHPKATLEIGSKLIRSYQGLKYEVEIVPQGYLYENTLYKSLSGVAKVITGKSWNGNIFFGVKK